MVLGLVATTFFPPKNRNEVRVILAGPSGDNPHLVLFVITNTSSYPMGYTTTIERQVGKVWAPDDLESFFNHRTIMEFSTERIEIAQLSTSRWRLVINYARTVKAPFAARMRSKLATYAYEHHWERLASWLYPFQKNSHAYSPIMLGNKPAEAELK